MNKRINSLLEGIRRELGEAAPATKLSPKAQAFFDAYIAGTWKENHNGIQKILQALGSKEPVDTGMHVGRAIVTRLNKPGGKHKHGTVSLKSTEGYGNDKVDLIILADKLKRALKEVPWCAHC